MDIAKLAKVVGPHLKRNSSVILTGLGVAGSLGSAVLAVKATPQAQHKLDRAFLTKNAAHEADDSVPVVGLTAVEVVKIVWKDYIPAVSLQAITIVSIIGAQKVNMRRQATLISMVTLSESALREYQDRVAIEAPTMDRKVRDDIAKAKIENNPVSSREVIVVGDGDQLFYDGYTDRYFTSSMHKVQKAVNEINFRILNQEYSALNEFYTLLGLKRISAGDELGWTAEDPLELDFTAEKTDDDRTAMVIEFVRAPKRDYWKGFR